MSGFRPAGRVLLGVAGLWIVCGGLLILELWPHLPASRTGWVVFAVFGPPCYALLAWLGGEFEGPPSTSSAGAEPQSFARRAAGVLVRLVLLVGLLIVSCLSAM